ncbi:MAG: tryptophan synthase subunit alpha [Ginsengibacter sp.]
MSTNKIEQLFQKKDKNILSIYFTAGFPKLNDTNEILAALQTNGADLIEIGMPYSDPLADGPVIQKSGMTAIENGMTIRTLFDQLHQYQNSERRNDSVPLVLMGYLNPVLQFGFEKFCEEARKAGISGIILPDLPIREFENEYKSIIEKNGLSFIFLITPETSEERIRKIDELTTGFIYAVSSSSITGSDTNMNAQESYFHRIQNLNLKNKVIIGFGIRDHATFSLACKYAAGAIIGTAYINQLEKESDINKTTEEFLNSILQA